MAFESFKIVPRNIHSFSKNNLAQSFQKLKKNEFKVVSKIFKSVLQIFQIIVKYKITEVHLQSLKVPKKGKFSTEKLRTYLVLVFLRILVLNLDIGINVTVYKMI